MTGTQQSASAVPTSAAATDALLPASLQTRINALRANQGVSPLRASGSMQIRPKSPDNVFDNALDAVLSHALGVFGPDAELWLADPIRPLDHRSPTEMLSSMEGIAEVEVVLGRLRHGVFS